MTTGPTGPRYTVVDGADIPGAVRFLLAELDGGQDELTRAYVGVEQVRLIAGLSTLLLTLALQIFGSKDDVRRFLDVVMLADRELLESGKLTRPAGGDDDAS